MILSFKRPHKKPTTHSQKRNYKKRRQRLRGLMALLIFKTLRFVHTKSLNLPVIGELMVIGFDEKSVFIFCGSFLLRGIKAKPTWSFATDTSNHRRCHFFLPTPATPPCPAGTATICRTVKNFHRNLVGLTCRSAKSRRQSSRGLEHSKTLRVFQPHCAARSVLDCGSPLPHFPATNETVLNCYDNRVKWFSIGQQKFFRQRHKLFQAQFFRAFHRRDF